MENRDKAMLLYGIEIFAYGYFYQGNNGAALFCACCAVVCGLMIRPYRGLEIHSWTVCLLLAGLLFWHNAPVMALWIAAVLNAWLTGLQIKADETQKTAQVIKRIWLVIATGMIGAFIFCLALGHTLSAIIRLLGAGASGLLIPMAIVLLQKRLGKNINSHAAKKAPISG